MSLVVDEANGVIIFRIAGTSGSGLKPALILSIYCSVHHAIPARDEDRLVWVETKGVQVCSIMIQWPDLSPRWWTVASSDWNLTLIYRVANGTWASSSINPEIGTHFCWIRTCQWAAPVSKGFRVQHSGNGTSFKNQLNLKENRHRKWKKQTFLPTYHLFFILLSDAGAKLLNNKSNSNCKMAEPHPTSNCISQVIQLETMRTRHGSLSAKTKRHFHPQQQQELHHSQTVATAMPYRTPLIGQVGAMMDFVLVLRVILVHGKSSKTCKHQTNDPSALPVLILCFYLYMH